MERILRAALAGTIYILLFTVNSFAQSDKEENNNYTGYESYGTQSASPYSSGGGMKNNTTGYYSAKKYKKKGGDDDDDNYSSDDDDNSYNSDDDHYSSDDDDGYNSDDDHYSSDDDDGYNSDDDDNNNEIPLDGGLSFLLAAGAGLGIKKAADLKNKKRQGNNK